MSTGHIPETAEDRSDGRRHGTGDGASDRRPRMGRRSFLSAVGVAGAAGLAGCTFSVDANGITWSDEGSTPTATGGTRTTTAGQPTSTTTSTTADDLVLDPVTMEPEPVDAVVVTPEPTTSEPTRTATPEPVPARYRVHDFRVTVVRADDGDVWTDDEELFGAVFVRGYHDRRGWFSPNGIGPLGVVYDIDRDDPLVVEEGETARLNVDVIVEFPDPATMDTSASYVAVGANFHEKDDVADDTLGKFTDGDHRYTWRLSDAQGGPSATSDGEVYFQDGGTRVRLSFDVTPLD